MRQAQLTYEEGYRDAVRGHLNNMRGRLNVAVDMDRFEEKHCLQDLIGHTQRKLDTAEKELERAKTTIDIKKENAHG